MYMYTVWSRESDVKMTYEHERLFWSCEFRPIMHKKTQSHSKAKQKNFYRRYGNNNVNSTDFSVKEFQNEYF